MTQCPKTSFIRSLSKRASPLGSLLFIFLATAVQGEVSVPKLVMSGSSSLNLHLFGNKERGYEGGKGKGQHLALESSKINFEADGEAEDFDYGLKITFSGEPNQTNSVSENRLKIKNQWGTLYGGHTRGPENKATCGGQRIMGATGGFDGKASKTRSVATGTEIKTEMIGDTDSATKLVYYTPRYKGVQLSVSFTPNHQHSGDKALATQNVPTGSYLPYAHNTVVSNLNFNHTFENDLNLTLALTSLSGQGRPGDVDKTRVSNLRAWGMGAVAYWRGFSLGGEYTDGGKSLVNTSDFENHRASKKYNVAAGYAFGPHRVAVGYFKAQAKGGRIKDVTKNTFATLPAGSALGTAKSQVVSVTYDRSIVPGLQVYGEANYFDTRTTENRLKAQKTLSELKDKKYSKPHPNNHGHSVILGTKLSF